MKTERRTAQKGPTNTTQISPQKKRLRQPRFLIAAVSILILVIWAYSNHFENPFEFDDSHTIVNNTAIRHLGNIPHFFTDSTSSSTLPANRAYRPGLTTLNAIDYAIQHHMDSLAKADTTSFAGKIERTFCPVWAENLIKGTAGTINPFWFHVSIFSTFLLLGFLLFYFLLHIFTKTFPDSAYSHWAALIGTGLFLLHTANAETINYIISRDDSFSTMMVLLAFVIYFYSEVSRKYFLFLIPIFAGYFVKEPTVMFAPLLLVYVWLFGDVDKNKVRLYCQIATAFFLAGFLYILTRKMTPMHHTYGGGGWLDYIFTQAFVIVHYFNSFLFPTNLSADTDWTLVGSPFDDRVIAGLFFIIALLVTAWKCSKKQELKPITFGILWFFIALAPTSLFSLSEVLNDHRPFFAYVGLVIAAANLLLLLLKNADSKNVRIIAIIMLVVTFTCVLGLVLFMGVKFSAFHYLVSSLCVLVTIASPLFSKKDSGTNSRLVISAALGFSGILLTAHAFGTHHRNKIWSSSELLWRDVTEKSPNNGRGWMNYGLSLMGKNSMDSAIMCFNKALSIYPNYSYANINMGLAQSKIGNDKGAEAFYTKAVSVDQYNPECYYYYGLYLVKMQRVNEAIAILNKGKEISPQHEGINILLNSLGNGNFKSNVEIAQEAVKQNPTPENYVNLSLQFYNTGQFLESAIAAKEAARIKPDYNLAWNNICAAYNKLGEWDSAVAAGTKAVELSPKDELSKNNYTYAFQQRIRFQKLEADAQKHKNANDWLNLSVEWDKVGNIHKSLVAAEEATLLNPSDPLGWNNVCAAANKLGDWDRAIIAGEKAVKLNPNFELAKNNLAEARKGKQNSGSH